MTTINSIVNAIEAGFSINTSDDMVNFIPSSVVVSIISAACEAAEIVGLCAVLEGIELSDTDDRTDDREDIIDVW